MGLEIITRLESKLGPKRTAVARDLKLNLARLLEEGSLSHEEALGVALAAAVAVDARSLAQAAQADLQGLGVSPELIEEAADCAAIMGMLNTYYRFRHMLLEGETDGVLAAQYGAAGLRMTALAKPVSGKERFELYAFAVSVLGGCQSCIKAHEKALRETGTSAEKIHDAARVAAVVKGLKVLLDQVPPIL